jgi:Tir chaperone protein (CesT) family
MADRTHVHALMTEIGPALELAEVQEFEQENLWALVARDGVVFFIDYQPDDERLWLSADVCVPPGERLALYGLMLQYNARWKDTGGVRLALDGPDGGVVQAYDMPVAGLDLHRLQTVIENFRETLDGWRKIVAASGQTDKPGVGGLDPMLMGVIRG